MELVHQLRFSVSELLFWSFAISFCISTQWEFWFSLWLLKILYRDLSSCSHKQFSKFQKKEYILSYGESKNSNNITNPDPPITERPEYEFDVYRLERLCPDPDAEEGGGTSNEILGDILIICAQVS